MALQILTVSPGYLYAVRFLSFDDTLITRKQCIMETKVWVTGKSGSLLPIANSNGKWLFGKEYELQKRKSVGLACVSSKTPLP